MLNENIKAIRKSKGLSQEELAIKLNVVRQTVSKWEKGLSVPDSEILVSLSEQLETPVSVLLGETVTEEREDELNVISKKLEVLNLQMANKNRRIRKIFHWAFIAFCVMIIVAFVVIGRMGSPYLSWDYSNPETAVLGVILHAFEWIFVRVAPITLIGGVIGVVLTREKR